MKMFSLKRSSLVAVLALASTLFLTTGCDTQQSIADIAATLTTAAAGIAQLESNPTLAAKLSADGNAVANAIQNWKTGSPATVAIELIGIFEADLSLIPDTSQYAPLIDFALGAAQGLLSKLPGATTPTTSAPVVSPTSSFLPARLILTKVTADGPAHKVRIVAPVKVKSRSDFVKKWNAIIAVHPELGKAAIVK